jgi:hypothetical protein
VTRARRATTIAKGARGVNKADDIRAALEQHERLKHEPFHLWTAEERRLAVALEEHATDWLRDLLAIADAAAEMIKESPMFAGMDIEGNFSCIFCDASNNVGTDEPHKPDCPAGRLIAAVKALEGDG